MQLLKVAKFYRRLYGGGQQIITFKLGYFTNFKALFSVGFFLNGPYKKLKKPWKGLLQED